MSSDSAIATNCLVTIGSPLFRIIGFMTEINPTTPTLTITMKTICSISVMPRWVASLMDIAGLCLDGNGQCGIESVETDDHTCARAPPRIEDNI